MRRAAGLLLALLLLGGLALGWGFVAFLGAAWAPAEALGTAPTPPGGAAAGTDAIVVLTGGAERVETALRLLEAGLAPRLLVSGAHPGLTLAELARAHGREPAALRGKVTLGRAAATTLGNAVEVAAYARALDIGSIRLVTAGYHMPRALLELRRAAPGLLVRPYPVMPALLDAGPAPAAPGGVVASTPAGVARPGRVLPGLRRWTLLSGEYLKYVAAAAGLTRFLPAKEQALR